MRYLKAFGQFWYDFMIGDDYKIVVAITLAAGALVAILKMSGQQDQIVAVLGGALIMAAFSLSLYIDTRKH